MADGLRRSTREIKLKKEAGFVYDDSLAPLLSRTESVGSAVELNIVNNDDDNVIQALTTWSVIEKLPTYINQDTNCDNYSSDSEVFSVSESVIQSQSRKHQNAEERVVVVDTSGPADVDGRRLHSSTRWDFLDLKDNFLSAASSSALTNVCFRERR